ncbi:MAG TPA: trigger factor [Planctomycetaceae bacterium]|nr:trigger factor [Planctomycetaceae bacterium]
MSSEDAGQAVVESEDVESRLALKVEITNVGACRKHVSVTVPEADIRTIRNSALSELSGKAQVPGFRVGRVPVALLEKRFKKEIASDIKQKVLVASLEQLSEDSKIEPINEPRIDVESLDVPDTGDFHYEFDVEVRPEFDLPDYAGIRITRSSADQTEEEFQEYKREFLDSCAERVAVVEPATLGDYVICDLTFSHEGKVLREVSGQSLRVMGQLDFQDAALGGFDKLMVGAKAGDSRQASVRISLQSPIVEMRGEDVALTLQVKEVQQSRMPTIDKEFCERLGAEDEESLNKLLRSSVTRQLEYQQRQETRRQVLEKITASADWDLPESLVRQQTENALRREVLEMTQAGFTHDQIMARENRIRQEALETTTQALKEHFVLDRIATAENIKCEDSDVERELLLMSFQERESVRKIRARMKKSGMIENLEAQIRERKAVDFILSRATFNEVAREQKKKENQASVRFAICGNMGSSLIDDTADEGESE